MTKILVIGAGGVGSVATHKMAMLQDVFSDITLASQLHIWRIHPEIGSELIFSVPTDGSIYKLWSA